MGSFFIPLSKRHYIPFSFQLIFVWAFDYHHTIPYQTVEEHLFDNRQKLQVSIGNIISFFMFVDWNECWAVCKMIYAPTFAVLNIQIALIDNRVSKENIHYSFFLVQCEPKQHFFPLSTILIDLLDKIWLHQMCATALTLLDLFVHGIFLWILLEI